MCWDFPSCRIKPEIIQNGPMGYYKNHSDKSWHGMRRYGDVVTVICDAK